MGVSIKGNPKFLPWRAGRGQGWLEGKLKAGEGKGEGGCVFEKMRSQCSHQRGRSGAALWLTECLGREETRMMDSREGRERLEPSSSDCGHQ